MNRSKYSRLAPAQRCKQILDAANALFAERAYDEVLIEDIASSAGVTRGLVHHYFGGRKQVYIALLERLGTLAQALGDGHPQEWQSACPDGRGATAGGQEYRSRGCAHQSRPRPLAAERIQRR